MDSFEFNKIAGGVLGAALGVMVLSIAAEAVFSPTIPAKPGMEVAVEEGGAGGAAAGGGDVAPIEARLQTADASKGEKDAKICQACHTLKKGEPAKVGPNLYGVVGGPVAHMEGFKYSAALQKLHDEGKTWTFDALDAFLTAPKADIPGTAMGFAGFKKPDQRADVIAYLRTLSDNPVPLPEAPAPAADAGAAAPPAGEAPAAAGTEPVPAPSEPATPSGAAPMEGATESGPTEQTPSTTGGAPAQ